MAWNLTDTETGWSVTFSPVSGELEVTVEQPTSVLYPLRSSSPVVLTGIARIGALKTPPWLVVGDVAWGAMQQILSSGHRLSVTTDLGDVYYCRARGGYSVAVEDTPDRATAARRRVTVDLVGVA